MADRFEIIFKKALSTGLGKEVQIIIDNNYKAGFTSLLNTDGKPVITNITTSKWNSR